MSQVVNRSRISFEFFRQESAKELDEVEFNKIQTMTPSIPINPPTKLLEFSEDDVNKSSDDSGVYRIESNHVVSIPQQCLSSPQLSNVIATTPLALGPIIWPQQATEQVSITTPVVLHPPSVTPPPTLVVPQQAVQLGNHTNSILQSNFIPIALPNPLQAGNIPTALPNPLQAGNGIMPGNLSGVLPLGTTPTMQQHVQSTLQQPQLPILSVQDHPCINPVYNGVNPAYPGLRILNQYPPIFAVDSFLTHAECDFLIGVAQDSFSPAPVVGKGAGEVSPSRTSTTCYLAREDLPIYMEKVCALTGKPVDHCELPQVGRYLPSQQYLQHFDAFDVSNEDGRRFVANGGQRTVTVLVYLNDVERGGGTFFPALNLEVKPKKGMAIVFFPATVDGLLDKMTLHAAKPAIDTKYVSQVWIRQGHYEGLPSKRMFSSVEHATAVQRSLLLPTHNGITNIHEPTSIVNVESST